MVVKSRPPSSSTLKVGESRSFTCDFYGYPWPTVVWTRDTSNSPITTRGRFSVHTRQVNSDDGYRITRSELEIHTAIERIEGTYSCSASNKDNFFTNITFTIDVIIPPKIVVEPTPLINMVAVPNVNQTLVVTCVALGSPRPSLLWKDITNGKILHNSKSVTIRETVKHHGGIELIHSQLELCEAESLSGTEYGCIAYTNANIDDSESEYFQVCTIGRYIDNTPALKKAINLDYT